MVGDFSSPRADGDACLGCCERGLDDRAVAGCGRRLVRAANAKLFSGAIGEPKEAVYRKTSSRLFRAKGEVTADGGCG